MRQINRCCILAKSSGHNYDDVKIEEAVVGLYIFTKRMVRQRSRCLNVEPLPKCAKSKETLMYSCPPPYPPTPPPKQKESDMSKTTLSLVPLPKYEMSNSEYFPYSTVARMEAQNRFLR